MLPRVGVISGGFPCQDVSNAGQRAGLAGARSGLWRSMVRAVRLVRPLYVVVENVAALLGRGMGTVLGDLAESGYDAEWDCLPACAFGAPHERDRVFIVCYPDRSGCQDKGRFVLRTKPVPGTHWLSEPGVCRVVDGVSGTVGDGGGNIEVAALANAAVPQITEWLGHRIVEDYNLGTCEPRPTNAPVRSTGC
jgi:DNA (cytosine-5)-methyltransferase 1